MQQGRSGRDVRLVLAVNKADLLPSQATPRRLEVQKLQDCCCGCMLQSSSLHCVAHCCAPPTLIQSHLVGKCIRAQVHLQQHAALRRSLTCSKGYGRQGAARDSTESHRVHALRTGS